MLPESKGLAPEGRTAFVPSGARRASAVTVCGTPDVFFHSTVSPAWTVTRAGLNLKPSVIRTMIGAVTLCSLCSWAKHSAAASSPTKSAKHKTKRCAHVTPRSQRRTLVFMACISSGFFGMRSCPGRARPGHDRSASLRLRCHCAQDGVILAEDQARLLGVLVVASVARGGRVRGHFLLERVLVAEAEIAPVAGLVLEALRVLDCSL